MTVNGKSYAFDNLTALPTEGDGIGLDTRCVVACAPDVVAVKVHGGKCKTYRSEARVGEKLNNSPGIRSFDVMAEVRCEHSALTKGLSIMLAGGGTCLSNAVSC